MFKNIKLNNDDAKECQGLGFSEDQILFIDYLFDKYLNKLSNSKSNTPVVSNFEIACDEVDNEFYTGEVVQENVVEFVKNSSVATGTFSQRRWISKMRQMAKDPKNHVDIVAENDDGSIVVHFPVSYVHISNRKRNRVMTDEQRLAAKERLAKAREVRFGSM